MKLYWKKTCSTCRDARKFLVEQGAKFDDVDLAPGLSVAELDALIGKRDYKQFLNFRNELYRERGMGKNPPSREEALRLMSENPNLVRRPLLVRGKAVVIGFDKDAMKEMAG
ncbi:MAG TPA: ArsC/Spx/MgsR family protein [Bryobacteraceae bacterium]|nr:ArsC/Spx/MgsR family protein [Bryobacteraceae bacterium]